VAKTRRKTRSGGVVRRADPGRPGHGWARRLEVAGAIGSIAAAIPIATALWPDPAVPAEVRGTQVVQGVRMDSEQAAYKFPVAPPACGEAGATVSFRASGGTPVASIPADVLGLVPDESQGSSPKPDTGTPSDHTQTPPDQTETPPDTPGTTGSQAPPETGHSNPPASTGGSGQGDEGGDTVGGGVGHDPGDSGGTDTGPGGSPGTTTTDGQTSAGKIPLAIVTPVSPQLSPDEEYSTANGLRLLITHGPLPDVKRVTKRFRTHRNDRGQLAIEGETVLIKARFEHMKHQCASVRWTLLEAKTRAPVDIPGLHDHPALRYEINEDAAPARPGEMWIPLPRHGGPFIVRTDIRDRKGELLDTSFSERFP
jgi:hypothetical protein